VSPTYEGSIREFPEFGQSRERLLARARELDWYHTLRLDDSFTTQGIFALDHFVPYFLMPDSLAGLECLEIGAGNGYWSFQMERRGAASVTATDIGNFADTDFSLYHGKPHPCPERNPAGAYGEQYRIAATLLNSRVRYKIVGVYDLRPQDLGQFDVVFCGSMLMHLFGPQLALQRIASVCRNALILTTETHINMDGESTMTYTGHQIPYVHFVPSPTCLANMLRACGYEQIVRGPTFQLEFRDRIQHPEPVMHTSFIALKDAARACVALPAPQATGAADRTARLGILSGPERVGAGQPFDLLVNVENTSRTAWRSPDKSPIRVESKLPAQYPAPVIEYLPAGLSTIVRLRLIAPATPGGLSIRLVVAQGDSRFESNEVAHELIVDGQHAPVLAKPQPPWLDPVLQAMRRAPGYRRAASAARGLLRRLP
jgi:tRNA (mo5U34)-methyltransferase